MRTKTYTPLQRKAAGLLSAIFILSMFLMMAMALSATANATEAKPIIEYKVMDTSGSKLDVANSYTVETGDTVTFEIDITNLTNPEMLSIVSDDKLQFQQIVEMTAIDRNNQVVPWTYHNTVPVNNKIEINATGLPDNVYRLNVVYTSTVLQSEQYIEHGVAGQVLYIDNGTTYAIDSADELYGLNFKLSVVDSSKNANTENFLDTGSYTMYYNSAMTRPVHFVKDGSTYHVVPEWDGRGEDHINIEETGTSNIVGLKSGVYYLTQTNAPADYSANIGVIELGLPGRRVGTNISTMVDILNDEDIALSSSAKLSTNANSLSIDYARTGFAQQVRSVLAEHTMPMLGLLCVAAGVAFFAVRKSNKEVHG